MIKPRLNGNRNYGGIGRRTTLKHGGYCPVLNFALLSRPLGVKHPAMEAFMAQQGLLWVRDPLVSQYEYYGYYVNANNE